MKEIKNKKVLLSLILVSAMLLIVILYTLYHFFIATWVEIPYSDNEVYKVSYRGLVYKNNENIKTLSKEEMGELRYYIKEIEKVENKVFNSYGEDCYIFINGKKNYINNYNVMEMRGVEKIVTGKNFGPIAVLSCLH